MSLIQVDNIEAYTGGSVSILSNLKLQSVPAGTSVNNLGIDASGFVIIGTGGGSGVFVTGGTYSNGTLDLVDSNGTIIPVTGFYTGGTFVESVTDDGNGVVVIDNTNPLNPIVIFTGVTTDGSTITGTGLAGSPLAVIGGGSGVFVTGGTYSNGTLDLVDSNGTIIPVTGFYTGSSDVVLTGASYDNVTGTLNLVDSTNTTIPVTGFYTGGTFVQSVTSVSESAISVNNTDPLNPILDFTGVTTDGSTITGTGLAGSPLTAVGVGGSSYWSASTGTNAIVINNSGSIASGTLAVAEGYNTTAGGAYSHAEGGGTIASGQSAHAEGQFTTAFGAWSHAEGYATVAAGTYSHSEGAYTVASGESAHAEGNISYAYGMASHAEGDNTTAIGDFSHSEGSYTVASGTASHAGGQQSIAQGTNSFVHSLNSLVTGNNSAIIGGSGINGTTDNTVFVPILSITTVMDYANDAAADADTNLPSGGLYTTSGSTGRTVYRKP